MPEPTCPKCAASMERGFLIDQDAMGGGRHAAEWGEGAPERSVWTGLKLRGRERYVVRSYRCPQCGYVELYAHAADRRIPGEPPPG